MLFNGIDCILLLMNLHRSMACLGTQQQQFLCKCNESARMVLVLVLGPRHKLKDLACRNPNLLPVSATLQ